MNWLIKVVSSAIARRIERGSRIGAVVGAMVLAVAFLCLWLLLTSQNDGDFVRYFRAPGCVFAVACGAMLGALVGARAKATSWMPNEFVRSLRVCRLNESLPSLFFACLFLVLAVLILVLPDRDMDGSKHPEQRYLFAAGLLAVAGYAAWAFSRQVIWIDFAERVKVRFGFRTQDVTDDPQFSWRVGQILRAPDDGIYVQAFIGDRVIMCTRVAEETLEELRIVAQRNGYPLPSS